MRNKKIQKRENQKMKNQKMKEKYLVRNSLFKRIKELNERRYQIQKKEDIIYYRETIEELSKEEIFEYILSEYTEFREETYPFINDDNRNNEMTSDKFKIENDKITLLSENFITDEILRIEIEKI